VMARAEADGPDHFSVTGMAIGQSLDLHAEADVRSQVIGQIPSTAQCVRNGGCQGGLSFEEFSTLSQEDQRLRLEVNPRWCKVDYRGSSGWALGRFLMEDACPVQAPELKQKNVTFKSGQTRVSFEGRVRGYESHDYFVIAGAGQTLTVRLNGSHAQNYFNVLPPGSESAMFIGSSNGHQFKRAAPVDGVYVVRVYLMRAAARRNVVSNFSLQIGLAGKALPALPAKEDGLIDGTPFHASAAVPCTLGVLPGVRNCDAHVIRRGRDGTATIHLRGGSGTLPVDRRLLLLKGVPVAADSPLEFTFRREGDLLTIDFGADEQYRIPDALVFGG